MHQNEQLALTLMEKLVVLLIPIVTTIIGYFLKPIINLIQHVPILSDFTVVRLIHEFDAPWLIWALTGLGLIVGLFLSMMTYDEILKLNITRDDIRVDIHGASYTIDKNEFGAAFKEGKRLFIFSQEGRELLQEGTENNTEDLKTVFTRFNYKWTDSDPYQDEYFKWTLDDARVSPRANDILYSRKEACRTGDEDQITALKDDLDEINIYVKDVDEIQWIRHIHPKD